MQKQRLSKFFKVHKKSTPIFWYSR